MRTKQELLIDNLVEDVIDGNWGKVRDALKSGIDPNMREKQGYTLTLWAVQKGQHEILELLAEYGADLDETSTLGLSPLDNAVGASDIETLKLLLALGANVNSDIKGRSILPYAVVVGDEAVIKLLIKSGADIDEVDEDGHSALMVASMFHRIKLVELLLSCGADVDVKDENGETAKDLAIRTVENTQADCDTITELLEG